MKPAKMVTVHKPDNMSEIRLRSGRRGTGSVLYTARFQSDSSWAYDMAHTDVAKWADKHGYDWAFYEHPDDYESW